MSTPVSAAAMRMKESIIRNPSLLEEGLEVLDSDISVLDEPPLDIFALDKEGLICVIIVRDGVEGERRDDAHGNILDDGKFYWHWITTFRDQFLPAAKKLSGRRVILSVPRIILVGQGFSQALVTLASSAGEYTPISFYAMDPSDPEAGATKVDIPAPSASELATRKFEQYQSERAEAFDHRNKGFVENSKSVAYTVVTTDDLVAEMPEERRAPFASLLDSLKSIDGLRLSARKNRITCNAASGHRAAEVVIGPGGGYSTTVYVYDAAAPGETTMKEQYSSDDAEAAVAGVAAALSNFP